MARETAGALYYVMFTKYWSTLVCDPYEIPLTYAWRIGAKLNTTGLRRTSMTPGTAIGVYNGYLTGYSLVVQRLMPI
jgi:hypothetical protein